MIKMSFYNGTLDRKEAMKLVSDTDKKLVYTYGYEYRNPITHRKPITLDEAIDKIKNESLLDITEEEDCIHLNAFSSNDMW